MALTGFLLSLWEGENYDPALLISSLLSGLIVGFFVLPFAEKKRNK
ncbi:hypothetical protein [Halobacillus litoralis]|nr:hypothetical protein [Halobacillus litoralis]